MSESSSLYVFYACPPLSDCIGKVPCERAQYYLEPFPWSLFVFPTPYLKPLSEFFLLQDCQSRKCSLHGDSGDIAS